jgi:hypothetical protein
MRRFSEIAGREPAGWHIIRVGLPLALLAIFVLLLTGSHTKAQQGPALLEDFSSGEEGGLTFLIANSSASASAFMLRQEINVHETPSLRWRWRTDNVYEKGDLSTKKGDDSPLRIYIMFEYDPDRATAGMRFKYAIAKAFYGEYPPHASLNYIWASKAPTGSMLENAYTGRSRMIVMRSGTSDTGLWVEEEADILKDYQRAFGEDPPKRARIAVMNDSDNTGEAAVSYIDYIEISAPDTVKTPAP